MCGPSLVAGTELSRLEVAHGSAWTVEPRAHDEALLQRLVPVALAAMPAERVGNEARHH
jgi:hypothetical protein